jgi:recombination protein RecA
MAASELDETFAKIQKRYGTSSYPIVRKGDNSYQPERIPTGSFVLDMALLGGIPMGKITQLLGNRHSGKSMMAYKVMGYAQRKYPEQTTVLIDVENSFDPVWARKLGADTETLEIVDADTGEMAVDIADAVLQSRETSLIVIDSLAALNPSKEMEESSEDHNVALQARLIGKLMRKMNYGIIKERKREHNVGVICLNQYRTKIGVMFGDPRTAPGGYAAEHFPHLTVQMKNKERVGKDPEYEIEQVVENEHAFKVVKNKVNNGPRTGEFRLCRMDRSEDFIKEGEIDDAKTMLSYAKKFGVYSGGGGSWTLAFEEYEHKVRNVDEAVRFLNENREWYWSLYNWLIREQSIRMGMDDYFVQRFEV